MAAVQRRNSFGVDDLLAHLQPGQERRRVALHPGAVEELLDAGRLTHRDDQRRPMVFDEQQCEVGGRPGCREGHGTDAQILDALEASGVPVGVGRQHDLRAAGEHLRAHLLGVADDQLRTVAAVAQHVRAAADPDQNRLVFLDERLEGLEILCGTGPVGDHHHMAAIDVDVDVGDANAVDQQRALAADVLDGVARERLQVGDQAGLRVVHEVADLFVGALHAVDQPAIPRVHPAFVQPNLGAVLDLLEDLRTAVVDQHNVVGDENFGSEVGIAARDRRRGVDHTGHPGVDERVGGDPVEVEDIEHDDVAGPDPAQQTVDVAVDSGGPGDTRSRTGIAGEKCRHLHGPDFGRVGGLERVGAP